MVRRTVHLTGFSVLKMPGLHASIYNRADTNKQWLPNMTSFFFLNTLQKSLKYRKHWGVWAIWWQLQESCKGKECSEKARRPCNYKSYLSPRVLSPHPPHHCQWEVTGDAVTAHSQANPKGEACSHTLLQRAHHDFGLLGFLILWGKTFRDCQEFGSQGCET